MCNLHISNYELLLSVQYEDTWLVVQHQKEDQRLFVADSVL